MGNDLECTTSPKAICWNDAFVRYLDHIVQIDISHERLLNNETDTHESHILFHSSHSDVIRILTEKIRVFEERTLHSQLGTFSHPSPKKASWNCLSHNDPANG